MPELQAAPGSSTTRKRALPLSLDSWWAMASERTFGHQIMRAELKRLHSPDIGDLTTYSPEESGSFGFLLQAMIGPSGQNGEESFDIVVCTPDWLKQSHSATDVVLGRHHIIVFRYDYERLANYIAEFAEGCSGKSWQDVAQQLSRLGKWEFEDYRE